MQIQENAYLQFFCGYTEYNDEKLPFDPSLMVYFRKRLTPEILGEINEMIIHNSESKENSGTEIGNLLAIRDHYSKYVVTLDDLASGNVDGVKIMHLADFLLM